MISGAFESPIVKRGQFQITRSIQVKELLNIGMYFFLHYRDDSNYIKKHELLWLIL